MVDSLQQQLGQARHNSGVDGTWQLQSVWTHNALPVPGRHWDLCHATCQPRTTNIHFPTPATITTRPTATQHHVFGNVRPTSSTIFNHEQKEKALGRSGDATGGQKAHLGCPEGKEGNRSCKTQSKTTYHLQACENSHTEPNPNYNTRSITAHCWSDHERTWSATHKENDSCDQYRKTGCDNEY